MKPTAFDHFFKLLFKLRYFTVCFWLICLILGAVIGTKIFAATANGIEAPSGTQAYAAKEITDKFFPGHTGENSVYGFFHNIGRENLTEIKCIEKVNLNFKYDLERYQKRNNVQLLGYKLVSYFLTDNEQLKMNLLSQNKNGTMLMIELASDDKHRAADFHLIEHMLQERIQGDCTDEERGDFIFGMMGQLALELDSQVRVVNEMQVMEYFCIPIALVILIIMFHSVRMLLIPALTTGTGALTAFMIMYPFAKSTFKLVTFAPTLMLSMCLAMSIDYALFFITRFREDLLKGKSVARATYEMQLYAGRIIILSGVILTIAFAGDMFLRNEMLFSLGLGLAVAIVLNMLVNYTLIPSLILAFPAFFSDFNYLGVGHCMSLVLGCRRKAWKMVGIKPFTPRRVVVTDDIESLNSDERTAGSFLLSHSENQHLLKGAHSSPQSDALREKGAGYSFDPGYSMCSTEEVIADLQKKQKKSCWFVLTSFTTQPVVAIILCVVTILLCIPFAVYFFTKFQNSIAIEQVLAHGSDTMETYHYIKQDFPPGQSQPLEVMIDASAIGGYISTATFTYFQTMFTEAAKEFPDIIDINDILSPFLNAGQPMTPEMIDTEARGLCEAQGGESLCGALEMAVHRYVSPVDGNNSAIVAIGTSEDPMSEAVYNWLPTFYDWLEDYLHTHEPPMPQPVEPEVDLSNSTSNSGNSPAFKKAFASKDQKYPFESKNGLKMGVDGSPVQLADTVVSMYKILPYMVSIALGIVFLLVGLIFRSVIVPLRTVFSLAVTLLTVYGFITLIIQNHMLSWIIPFMSEVDALYFFVPVFGFTLVLGLALDYDVFLYFRIVEYRDMGFTPRASVIKGMASSGSIINAAGIIMAVAFSGLVVSHMSILVELGLMLVLTVLYDTFVIRVFFVPALISLFGPANFWPGKRVKATREVDDVTDMLSRTQEVEEEEHWLQFMQITHGTHPTLASKAMSASEEYSDNLGHYFQPIRNKQRREADEETGKSRNQQPPRSLAVETYFQGSN